MNMIYPNNASVRGLIDEVRECNRYTAKQLAEISNKMPPKNEYEAEIINLKNEIKQLKAVIDKKDKIIKCQDATLTDCTEYLKQLENATTNEVPMPDRKYKMVSVSIPAFHVCKIVEE